MYEIKSLKESIQRFINLRKENVSVVFLDLKNTSNYVYINENETFPSASTIKVIIMAEALNQVINGVHDLHEKIRVKASDRTPYSIITCLENSTYEFIDILTLMIISSDNTASNILIDLLGMEKINDYAKKIGLKTTILKRKMMDVVAVKSGRENLTSASDMLILFQKIYNHEILDREMCNLMIKILSENTDHEMLLRYLPSDVKCAHKTGDLDNLNHDIGIFNINDNEYILGIFVRNSEFNYISKDIIGKLSKLVYGFFYSAL
ncbi:serine hydrolase [Clostridium guangxiense]|uniref:serine hydrolase n=1 Tax=Clostridium guangxiense TaxID=1662055 RepID=UPI001E48B27C|nr:serine hydrolase [Clostridium guangxiense]MCD2345699.1 class A beta-lactamase-related serine hydrolase [Clostridium guangxiense]